MIPTSTPVTPGKRDTALLILVAQDAQSLPETERSAGNQRLYTRAALDRLGVIRHARDLSFALDAIRDLLSLSDRPDQSCAAADAVARAQLVEVEIRLARLTAQKAELERMVVQCAGGRGMNAPGTDVTRLRG